MTDHVYDFADARPTQAQLAAGVGVGVARYVKKSLPNSFDLTKADRDMYLSWGLGVLYNAEQTSTDIVEQTPQYWADYGKYVADRLLSWGVATDQGINIAASADTFVSTANIPKAMNNFAAFAANCGPFGMIGYAQTNLIDLLVTERISPAGAKHWLPGAISWSGYANTTAGWAAYMAYPHAGMVQMFGSNIPGTDMNYLIDPAAMGFDWPAGNPYAPEDAMTEAQIQELAAAITTPIIGALTNVVISLAAHIDALPGGIKQQIGDIGVTPAQLEAAVQAAASSVVGGLTVTSQIGATQS